jgi:hypothetical protein
LRDGADFRSNAAKRLEQFLRAYQVLVLQMFCQRLAIELRPAGRKSTHPRNQNAFYGHPERRKRHPRIERHADVMRMTLQDKLLSETCILLHNLGSR